MAIEFLCPNDHPLTAEEAQSGSLVECPACGARLLVPAHAVPPSVLPARLLEDPGQKDYEAVGHDRLGLPVTFGEERPALLTARIGVLLHRAKVLVSVFGFIFCIIVSGFIFVMNLEPVLQKQMQEEMRKQQGQAQPRKNPFILRAPRKQVDPALNPEAEKEMNELIRKSQRQMTLLFWAHSAIIALLGLIGSWYLLAVPRSSHAGGLIAFSLLMDVVHLGANGLNQVFFQEKNLILTLVAMSALAVCYVLLMLFLHRFALYLGEPEVARHALHHLRSWSRLISASVFVGTAGVALVLGGRMWGAFLLVGGMVLLGIFWIFWIIRYVQLLSDMRRAIDRRLA